MLDRNLLNELESVFSVLDKKIVLEIFDSSHSDQKELISMLEDVSSTSSNIELFFNKEKREYPFFIIKDKGVKFKGIPNGHEFTSLILAILHSNLKGKMPDQGLLNRIKNIKGKISIDTYISLNCKKCPQVVESLNLISIINPNISHTMVDGQYFEKEINDLNIQGVPSVIIDSKLFLAGQQDLISIVEKLEEKFGVDDISSFNFDEYDVAVIGGGPAGVSSAIYTARKGLKTVIVSENIGGQVRDTKGIENLISIPYIEGGDLSNNLKKHLNEYNIDILERKVNSISQDKLIKFKNESLKAKSIIIATGAKWKRLNIGEEKLIGKGVAFCPTCDAPFYKNKDVIVVGGGNSGIEAAIDLAQIVKSVKVLEYSDKLIADKLLLKKADELENIEIITNAETVRVDGEEKVTSLDYKNRKTGKINNIPIDGIFIQIGLSPNTSFVDNLLKINKMGEIEIDVKCKTSIDGIFAAGDVTNTPYKQIIISMGEGAKAGLSAFEYLKL